MRFLRTVLSFALASCALTTMATAQDSFDVPPAHLSVVEGAVTLDREDAVEPAATGVPVVPGDRIYTERGRAELMFPDGSVLDLDEYTSVEVQGPTLVFLRSGRVLLFAGEPFAPSGPVQYQIDTPIASAQTDGPGEYRVAVFDDRGRVQTDMSVLRGAGALVTDRGSVPLRAGQQSTAWDNGLPSRPQFVNARYDAFDRWAFALRDQRQGGRSAQYLPADLRIYAGQFDRYGSWGYEASYGNVWYPTVAADWRPYYDGYWSSVPTYGWTWIGLDIWSWPTHHYGRWGYARDRWFWIPDRRWAPAWVYWGDAPGYVSWCPLGYDNRPVFSLSVSLGGGGWGGNSWRGWTVISRDHFGGRYNAQRYAVAPRSLPRAVNFVARASAPIPAPHVVARRGFESGRQGSGSRQFPAYSGRTGDTRPYSADNRQYSTPRRSGVAGDRPVDGQAPRAQVPGTATRSPQAVPRQPQTYGQPYGAPTYGQGRSADSPRAVQRQRQLPSPLPSAQPLPSARPLPSTQPQTQAQPSESNRYRARPIDPRVNQQAPQPPSNPNPGYARPRYEQRVPAPQAAPAPNVSPPEPRVSRRGGGPIYSQRPTAQPPAAVTAPAPREQRAAPPPRQQENGQARSRGHEKAQDSSSQQESRGNGHHRR